MDVTSTQRMRNVLALAEARENGRPVPADRVLLHAEAAGLARAEALAALARLAQEGLARQGAAGWSLRPAPLSTGVCLDHGLRVRLRG